MSVRKNIPYKNTETNISQEELSTEFESEKSLFKNKSLNRNRNSKPLVFLDMKKENERHIEKNIMKEKVQDNNVYVSLNPFDSPPKSFSSNETETIIIGMNENVNAGEFLRRNCDNVSRDDSDNSDTKKNNIKADTITKSYDYICINDNIDNNDNDKKNDNNNSNTNKKNNDSNDNSKLKNNNVINISNNNNYSKIMIERSKPKHQNDRDNNNVNINYYEINNVQNSQIFENQNPKNISTLPRHHPISSFYFEYLWKKVLFLLLSSNCVIIFWTLQFPQIFNFAFLNSEKNKNIVSTLSCTFGLAICVCTVAWMVLIIKVSKEKYRHLID